MKLLLSFIVFVAVSFQLKRYFDRTELPKGPTRSILIFSLALAVSYAVAALFGSASAADCDSVMDSVMSSRARFTQSLPSADAGFSLAGVSVW